MDLETQVQIADDDICILHCVYGHTKEKNSYLLPPAMGK